ncbi:MAG: peptidylprolyl isomerase [Myxococcota bacterium]
MRHPIIALLATLFALPGAAVAAEPEWPPPGGRVVDGIVAVVNQEPVTLYDLERAITPFEARVQASGEVLDDAKRGQIREQVLEGLVNDILILEKAREMDLEADPSQVEAQIDRLKEENGWTDEQLARALQSHGFPSIGAYRRHVEKEVLKNEVLSIKVASKVQVDEAEVERLFEQELGETGAVTQRRAAHILLRLDEFATPEQEAVAERKLLEIREEIVSGEASFEEMARRHSDDTNAQSGGDLGWFSKGDLDPSFESAAWQLDEGEVSEPVRTDFGLHLIKVTGLRDRQMVDEEEKDNLMRQIRYRVREKELERVYEQWVEGLRKSAYVEIRRDVAGVE